VGAGEIRASYSRSKFDDGERADQFALGYVHNLSKRTALYATIAQVRNKNDAALSVAASTAGATSVPGVTNARGRGFDIGIRHAF
jgi:predicted porin